MPNLPELQTSSYPPSPLNPRVETTFAEVAADGYALNSTVQADPRSHAALAAAEIEEPVEKEPLKAVGGTNGDTCCVDGEPTIVSATPAVLVSTKVLLWHVNRTVADPVIAATLVPPVACTAASSAVGGVKAPVYTTVPFTTRTLLRDPGHVSDGVWDPPMSNECPPELKDDVTTKSKLSAPFT